MGEADEIDWERASLDSASVPASGGQKTGKNSTDRGKQGSKRHLLVVNRDGVPLALKHSAANVHDSKMLEEMLDAIRPIRRPRCRPGRPRKRPKKLHAGKGYDFAQCREALRKRGSRRASLDGESTQASGWGGTGG